MKRAACVLLIVLLAFLLVLLSLGVLDEHLPSVDDILQMRSVAQLAYELLYVSAAHRYVHDVAQPVSHTSVVGKDIVAVALNVVECTLYGEFLYVQHNGFLHMRHFH